MKLRSCIAALAVLAATAPVVAEPYVVGPDIPVLDGILLTGRHAERPLSFLIEVNAVTPEQALVSLDQVSRVEIEVISGQAEFLIPARNGISNRRKVVYKSDLVEMPAIKVGRKGSDSSVEIRVDGDLLGDRIRIGTMGRDELDHSVENPVMRPAVLLFDKDRRYAIVDESRMDLRPSTLEEGSELLRRSLEESDESGSVVRIFDEDGPFPDIDHCPLDMWRRPEIADRLPRSSCLFNVVPVGRLEWQGNGNPQNAGYSVKPESSSVLVVCVTQMPTYPEPFGLV